MVPLSVRGRDPASRTDVPIERTSVERAAWVAVDALANRSPAEPLRHGRRLPNGNTAEAVADALADRVSEVPELLQRSLTWDQGK